MTVPTILIEGVGDVTDLVVYDQTELSFAAQGETSPSTLSIKDTGAIEEFTSGARVTVDLDGEVIWAGFIVHAERGFWFDADTTTTTNRRWELTLADLNILFSRRVVFKQSNPEKITGPVYRDPTYDDTVIDKLVTDWLDIDDDDIDTSSLVERVGIVNPSSVGCDPASQAFYPFNASFTWGEAMETIAQMPMAIWGLLPGEPLGSSPFGKLFYADVDQGVPPYVLTDNPTNSGHIGYREAAIWEDASGMVNESFAWGAGKGSNRLVFGHETATASIEDHGLWQQADLLYNIWCQDTIDKVTDSIVNGSPGSRRGGKNPLTSVELVVHEDGFRVGQRVRVINEEFGFDEVLPIRHMDVSFPTPTDRRYKLFLSEARDTWGFQDPPLPFPTFREPKIYIPEIDEIFPPFPPPGCDELPFDDFDRTVTSSMGATVTGHIWQHSTGVGFVIPSVNGAELVCQFTDTNRILYAFFQEGVDEGVPPELKQNEFVMTARFKQSTNVTGEQDTISHTWYDSGFSEVLNLVLNLRTDDPSIEVSAVTTSDDAVLPTLSLNAFYWYKLDFKAGSHARVRFWADSSTEPSTWDIDLDLTSDTTDLTDTELWEFVQEMQTGSLRVRHFDEIDIDYPGKPCFSTAIIDDFNRTESGELGCASSGYPWTANADALLSVDGEKYVYAKTTSGSSSTDDDLNHPYDPKVATFSAVLGLKVQEHTGVSGQGNFVGLEMEIHRKEGATTHDRVGFTINMVSPSTLAPEFFEMSLRNEVGLGDTFEETTFAVGTIPTESEVTLTLTEDLVSLTWLNTTLSLAKTWATPTDPDEIQTVITLRPSIRLGSGEPTPADQYVTLDDLQAGFTLPTTVELTTCP